MTMPRFADFLGRLACNLIGVALCGSASSMPSAPATMRVGSILLERCVNVPAYCGRLDRPLDPSGAIPGRISIYFEFYPHTGRGTPAETLVATEGGPGYPATLSRSDYLALFKPLRAAHDVVLMDNRGTGQSGAIDCRELQTGERWTVESVAACGESLGDRAALYSTAYAADDLAAILEALDVRQIDLYGDSYGTYFEQVFALRHPHTLRSIVLDGAYPLDGPDYAWYPTYAPAMRAKFNIACRRSKACAELPGSSIEHVTPLIERLRAAPVRRACRRRRRPGAHLYRQCLAARHRDVRERPSPRLGARARCGRQSLHGRGSRAAAAAHGGNPEAASIPAIPPRMPPSGAPASRRR